MAGAPNALLQQHGLQHRTLRAPRRPAGVALEAGPVADHGEVAAFGAGFADVAFHARFGSLLGDGASGGNLFHFFPLCFAWAKSDPATDLTFFGVRLLLSNLLDLEASFFDVVIRKPFHTFFRKAQTSTHLTNTLSSTHRCRT
jgi:hypothetical protein